VAALPARGAGHGFELPEDAFVHLA
jgi:hypothetical protein